MLQKGQTALFVAARSNNLSAVEELLHRNADPNIVDRNHDSALHVSLRLRLSDIAEMLLLDRRTQRHNARNAGSNKKAIELVDPANERLVGLLLGDSAHDDGSGAESAAGGYLQRRSRGAVLRDVFVYAVLGLICYCIATVQQQHSQHGPAVLLRAAAQMFESGSSFVLLPLFAASLLYSFYG